MLRVLTGGAPKKYTYTVHLPNGKKIEFQSDDSFVVKWNDSLREPWLFSGYPEFSIMRWDAGSILMREENPKP